MAHNTCHIRNQLDHTRTQIPVSEYIPIRHFLCVPLQKLRKLASASAEEQARLKTSYQARLDATVAKLKALQVAARGFASLQRLQQATDDTCKRLKGEMMSIKQQKVRQPLRVLF